MISPYIPIFCDPAGNQTWRARKSPGHFGDVPNERRRGRAGPVVRDHWPHLFPEAVTGGRGVEAADMVYAHILDGSKQLLKQRCLWGDLVACT